MSYRLELRGISKRYPGVLANDEVSLGVEPGEIHAVLGENGAGKSTLMKIVYGALRPDSGQMLWNGVRVELRSPAAARALGIGMVFQHFMLFDALTVAENVLLGLPPGHRLSTLQAELLGLIERYQLEIDPTQTVAALSVGERQRVELLRALAGNPQLLILDEPTSVLAPQAKEKLFSTLRQLAAEGRSIIYISHKLDEIRQLCHSCTILRAGRQVGRVDPRLASQDELATLMIGEAVSEPVPGAWDEAQTHEPALSIHELSLPAPDRGGLGLKNVSLVLRTGEILGIAGVSGSGQGLLLSVLSGEHVSASACSVRLFGKDVGKLSVQRRRELGLRSIPEERLGKGCVPDMSLVDNLLLTALPRLATWRGWIRRRHLAAATGRLLDRYRIRAAGPQAQAQSLSGGNLQKYLVAREIEGQPTVLLAAQPTWGVDVAASARIHQELIALRDQGCAILLVSEDLDELFQVCDRLAVMAEGRLSPVLTRAQANVETIGRWMGGRWEGDRVAA